MATFEKDERNTSWNPEVDGPKVTVEYILPHHQDELTHAMQASAVRSIIYELFSEIRNSAKHGAPFHGKSVRQEDAEPGTEQSLMGHAEKPYDYNKIEMLEAVRDYLIEEAQERGIDLTSF